MSMDDLYIPHVPRSGIDKMLTYGTKYIEYYSPSHFQLVHQRAEKTIILYEHGYMCTCT